MSDWPNQRRSALGAWCAIALVYLLSGTQALAGSLPIPIHEHGAPAIDLVYQGRVLDRDEAIDLQDQGIDISRLDPSSSDVWVPTPQSLTNEDQWNYPPEGATVTFDSKMLSSKELFRARILTDGTDPRPFQLMMSLNLHAALTRAALLRKLGYTIPSPKFYSRLTIRFPDIAARTDFIDELSRQTQASPKRWLVSAPDDAPVATFQDLSLEPAQIDVPPYHWGMIRSDYIAGRRAVRALVVPIVLGDISESVNLYSWEMGKILNDHVVLTSLYADQFQETTYEDARWIARKIARLTREDFTGIVAQGHFPPDVAALVTEKMIARRDHLVQLFALSDELPARDRKLPFDLHLRRGAIKDGKLTQSTYPGYALRFSYGDPSSPLRRSELLRYLGMEALSSAIGQGIGWINHHLWLQSMGDLGKDHQDKLASEVKKHFQEHPNQPYQQPLETWGGPLASGAIQASRNVVTGTYYGADSMVQLVDSVGISAQVGYFLGLDGVPNAAVGMQGNVSLQRNYLHVRPVADMKSAWKTDWKSLLVPHFMDKLADMLNYKPGDGKTDPLKSFLEDLKEGEMFVVTDSVVVGARESATIPIAPLIQMSFFGWQKTSATFSSGQVFNVIRRTTFVRTSTGIQVYLQSVDSKSADVGFDFSYFIHVLQLDASEKNSNALTKAYLIDQIPSDAESRKRLGIAIQALLRSNNSELLETGFPDYVLKHHMDVKEKKGKFLFWRWNTLEESHLLKLRPPSDPAHPIDASQYERTLYSHRIQTMQGRDSYGFFSDLVGLLNRNIGLPPPSGDPNPADSFLGSSRWKSVTTEEEITPGNLSDPVSIIEHHWGGWSLSKKGLFKLLDKIEEKMRPLNLGNPLIRREEFNNTKQLQMYEVSSHLLLYQDGLAMVRNLFSVKTPLKQVFYALVELNGADDLKSYCESRQHPVAIGNYPDLAYMNPDAYTEFDHGKRTDLLCIKPWMRTVLNLRQHYPGSDLKKQAKWTTQLLRTLDDNGDFTKILAWVGSDRYFFQIAIRGFRTHDENGDMDYVSDSVGSVDPKDGGGIFATIGTKYKIMDHELYARYLDEGY